MEPMCSFIYQHTTEHAEVQAGSGMKAYILDSQSRNGNEVAMSFSSRCAVPVAA